MIEAGGTGFGSFISWTASEERQRIDLRSVAPGSLTPAAYFRRARQQRRGPPTRSCDDFEQKLAKTGAIFLIDPD